MKKIVDFAAVAVALVAAAGLVSHFQVQHELLTLLKSVAHKIVPWVNNIVYS